MERETFERFRSIIYRESGIVLPPEKLPLLSSRIQKRLHALGIADEVEYLNVIELDVSGEELINLIDVVSTNVTYFYREPGHFETLRGILHGWRKENRTDLKIWCAAASSGEEPYTIAFEVAESVDLNKQKPRILATDICTKVLRKATAGVYSDLVVSKIPQDVKAKYFTQTEEDGVLSWEVKPQISEMLLFKKLNLVDFPYQLKGPIDIIFCRNVMIYFDVPTRSKIVREFARLLRPGGYLFLSHSENLLGIDHDFVKMGASVFQKK